MSKFPYRIPIATDRRNDADRWLQENAGPCWPEEAAEWYEFSGFMRFRTRVHAHSFAERYAPPIASLPFIVIVKADDNVLVAQWAKGEFGPACDHCWNMHASVIRFAQEKFAFECALRFR